MKNQSQSKKSKRPLSITLICAYDFIILLLGMALFSLPAVREFFPAQEIFLLHLVNLWLIAYLIVVMGLWRMKKWAGYIYILVVTYNLATGDVSSSSLVTMTLSVYFVAKNISKMS
ncbi:MAG: hypothetical protein AAGE84_22060 [Cyanobacteria bacterium P01_G01_bin.39]